MSQDQNPVIYLRSLPAIRERCNRVFELAQEGKLEYFEWVPEKEQDVVEYCKKIVQRDFRSNYGQIPPHGRRNHFTTPLPTPIDRIALLRAATSFPSDKHEATRSLIDLYIVSVLLDAGAGNKWTYEEVQVPIGPDAQGKSGKTGWQGGRSEGLAVASFWMFVAGVFSKHGSSDPFRVDAEALVKLTVSDLAKHLQVTDDNPMDGLKGRAGLLSALGKALLAKPEFYKSGRPGEMLDYLKATASTSEGTTTIRIEPLWQLLLATLAPVWPARLTLNGEPLGDVWPCHALAASLDQQGISRTEGDDYLPFHKLSQWLCYSLIQPMEEVAGWKVEGWKTLMTGLPEYRNGGLLLDLGLLKLKSSTPAKLPINDSTGLPRLRPDHPAIIEWRAMTVVVLDRIAQGVRDALGLGGDDLSLAQVLEAATWKGGREIAMQKRKESGGGPPIEIESDGTVF